MGILKNHIDNIISECNNQINDKIQGSNYLEKLKYPLIDQLKSFNKDQILDSKNQEFSKKFGKNNLLIEVNKFSESISKMKHKTHDDCLSLVLEGAKNIEIFDNVSSNLSHFLNLFPKTGIVISINSIITEFVSKETVLLNIHNIIENTDIEK